MLGLGNTITGGAALAEFTPADLSGIMHWWRSDVGVEESDESTPEDGEQITKWRDQVGTEHATAASNWPTWDSTESALAFGASGLLGLPSGDVSLSGDFSIWVRVKFVGSTNDDKFIIDSSASNMFWRITSGGSKSRLKVAAGGSGNNDFTIPTIVLSGSGGEYYNIGIERTSGNVRLYVGNTESSTGALSETTTITFDQIKGSTSDYFKTLIVCNSALSTNERTNLNTWLDASL
jgi:hypothetical protein